MIAKRGEVPLGSREEQDSRSNGEESVSNVFKEVSKEIAGSGQHRFIWCRYEGNQFQFWMSSSV